MQISISISTLVLVWKLLGIPFFLWSCYAFVRGDLPAHNEGTPLGNASRFIAWPLFAIWILSIFIRGLWL